MVRNGEASDTGRESEAQHPEGDVQEDAAGAPPMGHHHQQDQELGEEEDEGPPQFNPHHPLFQVATLDQLLSDGTSRPGTSSHSFGSSDYDD